MSLCRYIAVPDFAGSVLLICADNIVGLIYYLISKSVGVISKEVRVLCLIIDIA